jgi:hypothetical protein
MYHKKSCMNPEPCLKNPESTPDAGDEVRASLDPIAWLVDPRDALRVCDCMHVLDPLHGVTLTLLAMLTYNRPIDTTNVWRTLDTRPVAAAAITHTCKSRIRQ